MTVTTIPAPETRPTTTTPGTCTAEEFVEAFMVTGLVPVPGGMFTTLADGRQGACALGARDVHRTGRSVAQFMTLRTVPLVGLDSQFRNGVGNGFDATRHVSDQDHPLYQQGYAVGQKVRELMGVKS